MSVVFARRRSNGHRYSSRSGTSRELLTSARGVDGVWHAHYPTARRTLCGLLLSEVPRPGRRRPPTCLCCVADSLKVDALDGSVPDHWREA